MNISSYVRPYFDVYWCDEITADQALEKGKAAAIRNLQRQIAEVEALEFEPFARVHCAPDITPETTR